MLASYWMIPVKQPRGLSTKYFGTRSTQQYVQLRKGLFPNKFFHSDDVNSQCLRMPMDLLQQLLLSLTAILLLMLQAPTGHL